MHAIKAVVVSGSSSRPSKTLTLALRILAAVEAELTIEAHVVDIAEVGSEIGSALSRRELATAGERALALVESADLLIAATPVYRGSYTGHFKHVFDLIAQDALTDVPVILAATGGGERHCLVIEHQLRPLFAFLQAFAVPIGVYASANDFVDGGVASPIVLSRIEAAARQAARLVRQRARVGSANAAESA